MEANRAKTDPLVRIKQQEVDLRAMDMQRKANETRFKQDQENQRQANKLNLEYDRLAQQDEQSDKRLDIAERKLEKIMPKYFFGIAYKYGKPIVKGASKKFQKTI